MFLAAPRGDSLRFPWKEVAPQGCILGGMELLWERCSSHCTGGWVFLPMAMLSSWGQEREPTAGLTKLGPTMCVFLTGKSSASFLCR